MNRQARDFFSFISSSGGDNFLALQDTSAQPSYYLQRVYTLLLRHIYTADNLEVLGRQLSGVAQHAYFTKQIETLDQISRLILALPVSRELKWIASYYQAICATRKAEFDQARRLLEGVMEEATPLYKARALQAKGVTYHTGGDVDAALPFYVAAGKAAINCDPLTLIWSQQMVAVVRSIHGDHKQSLEGLEQLFPLARAIGRHYPVFYYDYLNSLAVELGEAGRLNEARNICRITLDSPFASAYPNWLETRDELEAKRVSSMLSVIAVGAKPQIQTQPSRKVEPALSAAVARECFFIQRSIAIVVVTTVVPIETTTSILDRVEYSICPRGPPARF